MRSVGGVRTPRRGLDKLNADGVCDGRSALRNVMNGQVERGSQKLVLALTHFSGVLGGWYPLTLGQKVRIEGTVALPARSSAAQGEAKAWAAAEDAKGYTCACGCGGRIRVMARHFRKGVPKYLPAHHFRRERTR